MSESQSLLSDVAAPLCSLGLYSRRVSGSVVGRPIELAAAAQELSAAQRGLNCLTLEGEPGIGKTRLLLAIQDMAAEEGFTTIAVTSDEEIRGPFLLARSIFACPAPFQAPPGTAVEASIQRVVV